MIEMVSSHGGMNYYDFGLMMGLGRLGNDVTLYTSEPLLFDITSNKNLKVNLAYKGLFGTKNKFLMLLHYIKGTFKSLNDSRRRKVKIIHFQIYAITYLESFVVWLTKKMGFKLIVTIHDVESFNKQNRKKLTSFFYNSVDKIIVHNNVSYNTILNIIEEYSNSEEIKTKCNIIPHGSYIGMLPKKMEKHAAKKVFNLENDTFTFLFFGQIKKVKGLDILLKAYSKFLKKTNKKVKLIIAGKVWKDDAEIYDKIIQEENLKNDLIMDIKYIPDSDIVKYYSAADCIVLPYKKIFQSGVLLMAQSYKVPVIVSDLPGMTEIVENLKNGFIFESESVDDLVISMEKVISCDDLNSICENAYNKLLEKYNWDVIAEKQAAVMLGMLNE